MSHKKYIGYYYLKLKHNQPLTLSPSPWERAGGEVCFKINKTRHYFVPVIYISTPYRITLATESIPVNCPDLPP